MQILDKTDPAACAEYEDFVKNSKYGTFTQSLRWPGVKKNWQWEAVVSKDADGNIKGTCLVLIQRAPVVGVSFLYAPRGPICDLRDKDTVLDIFEGIKKLAKKYKCFEFKWDPLYDENETDISEFFVSMGFAHVYHAPEGTTIQVRSAYILPDIKGKTPDELMANFHPDWRNRIRKAPRKGVYCLKCGKEAVDDFYPLMEVTGKRDGFNIRPKQYFVDMLDALGEEHARLFMCYVDEDDKRIPLSGALSTQYAGKTCYVYGASADHHRNLYPNYLMQWTMINWALENGCDIYDFQGIPYFHDPEHPHYGVYKFKKGFNGQIVLYAGEFSYVFDPVAKKLVDATRKIKR